MSDWLTVLESLAGADAVDVHPQRTLGGFGRVLLPQRTCGSVARVGQRRLAGLDQGFVEFSEGLGRDEDFAADFHLGREAGAAELLRDFLDGQDVVRDVLAGGAVAAGGGPDQRPVAVEQVDGQAVDLQFGEPRRRVAAVAELGDARLGLHHPGLKLLEREDIFQAVHALQVLDGGKRRRHLAADFLRGRIVGHQFRMHGFERFQPPVELVELGVGDGRRVLLVVRKAVLADLFHKVFVLRADVPGRDLLALGG